MSEPQQEDNEQFRFVNNIVLPDFDSLSFSDFDVIRQLGKGDVGVVQLVHLRSYPPNEQLYALKVLDNQDMIDRNKTQRCLTERTILEVTAHPFVVTMYTTFITEAKTYLLLEYCPGGEFFRFALFLRS
jgi:protein-serine/threonine kinase